METAKSRASTLVLLCLKVENLAELREGFGPSAVETSLCEAAKLLASSFRKTDIVARLGESQFAALAVDAAEPSAPVLRQRLERRVVMHNQDRGAWGPLELRTSVRFWSAKEAMVFSEFLKVSRRSCALQRFGLPRRLRCAKRSRRLKKDEPPSQ
jgi:GGDEF domain-containing protein